MIASADVEVEHDVVLDSARNTTNELLNAVASVNKEVAKEGVELNGESAVGQSQEAIIVEGNLSKFLLILSFETTNACLNFY